MPSPRTNFFEVLLAVVVVLGVCALGCANPGGSSGRPSARPRRAISVFQPHRGAPARAVARRANDEGAAFVAANLRRSGLQFGTDGSARALWGYLSLTHQPIAPEVAAPGRRPVLRHARHGGVRGVRGPRRRRRDRRRGRPHHVRRSARRAGSPELRRPVAPERATQRGGRHRQQLPARKDRRGSVRRPLLRRRAVVRRVRVTVPRACCQRSSRRAHGLAARAQGAWRARLRLVRVPRWRTGGRHVVARSFVCSARCAGLVWVSPFRRCGRARRARWSRR